MQCAPLAAAEKSLAVQYTFDWESRMIDVDALIAFAAVIDTGSFSAAAERLGQTPRASAAPFRGWKRSSA